MTGTNTQETHNRDKEDKKVIISDIDCTLFGISDLFPGCSRRIV